MAARACTSGTFSAATRTCFSCTRPPRISAGIISRSASTSVTWYRLRIHVASSIISGRITGSGVRIRFSGFSFSGGTSVSSVSDTTKPSSVRGPKGTSTCWPGCGRISGGTA